LKQGCIGRKGKLSILLPKEEGIREAGPNNPFIAGSDLTLLRKNAVHNDNKVGSCLPRLLIEQTENTLMMGKGRPNNFLGEIQKLRIKGAHHGGGPLGETPILFEKGFKASLPGNTVDFLGKAKKVGTNLFYPILPSQEDKGIPSLGGEARGTFYKKGRGRKIFFWRLLLQGFSQGRNPSAVALTHPPRGKPSP
jgi:hypothetical protein